MAKEEKKALVPKLRFPEFRGDAAWVPNELGDSLDYLQPTPYLVNSTTYSDSYETPVVTAGKTFILGYTDETGGVFDQPLPVIIFDDFTTASQFVDFRFKAKSSAMKILLAKKNVNIKFVYESMQQIDYEVGAHGRHWISAYSKIQVALPTPGEQKKIADCLTSLDELIAAQGRKVEALKTYKRGLMQQLFPREGETLPRLRFPEFRDAPEWKETKLASLGDLVSGLTYSPEDVRESGLLVLRSSNVQNAEIALDDNVYVTPGIKGANHVQPNDILICVRNGSKTLIGKSALIPEGMPLCTHGAFMTVFRAHAPQFAFQLMQSALFHKQVAADLGATINSINGSQLLKYRFVVPGSDEQNRIADFLSSLAARIAIEAKNLLSLKVHKNGLTQQLFPSLKEA
jgi:type I restriction enzyme, S subunit